ncbi:MAG: prephenate dehydrogenase/arogenate dehydrogenase family protein [Planctomycetaceae bacterium]|nr:prephenate dehydrogenase/arogenate dehydrogenase family protein [Planctomycetaceae bacterium]
MLQETDNEQRVVIVGVGLIGGSIAAALRVRLPECRIAGVGRNAERLQAAADAGLLDEFSTQVTDFIVGENSLTVVCLPVDQIARCVRQVCLHAGSNCVVTDAGSIKGAIYESLRSDGGVPVQFVGSHPIAGSEQSGFEFADADLYVQRTCVVTAESAAPALVRRVERFWKLLGSSVALMDADEHDRTLAVTSHLPHAMACATAGVLDPALLPFSGTGFRDTTRVAAGSVDVWQSIMNGNRTHLVNAIDRAIVSLQQLRTAVHVGDQAALRAWLEHAASVRRQLH